MIVLDVRGQPREFVPVRDFRAANGLPPDFGINLFVEKDYARLGSIEGAANELRSLRQSVLAAIPFQVPDSGWMGFSLAIQLIFNHKLREVNPRIGLRRSEIEYAVIGFGQVIQAFIHAMIEARMRGAPLPDFAQVYTDWLNRTVEVSSQTTFPYRHGEQEWRVSVVRHAFGRIGLIVQTDRATHHVYDPEIACPAESFMYLLLRDVASRLSTLMQNAG